MGLATQDLKNEREALQLVDGETLNELAARLFYTQMEVYSSYAGHDLAPNGTFSRLNATAKRGWLVAAQEKRDS